MTDLGCSWDSSPALQGGEYVNTDFRALCGELVNELEGWIAYGDEADTADAHVLVDRARAALAKPESEVYYEFVVSNDEGCTEAGGTAPTLSQAIDEGRHYLAQYSQDGHYTLEVRCVETFLIRRSN